MAAVVVLAALAGWAGSPSGHTTGTQGLVASQSGRGPSHFTVTVPAGTRAVVVDLSCEGSGSGAVYLLTSTLGGDGIGCRGNPGPALGEQERTGYPSHDVDTQETVSVIVDAGVAWTFTLWGLPSYPAPDETFIAPTPTASTG